MSVALAKQVATAREAELLPVLATIEAESNFRNTLGEYAAWSARFGIGFGQVHLRWHFDSLQQVAAELDIQLPSQHNPMHDDRANEPFRRLILGNDLLSMHLAVAVIDRVWRGTREFGAFQRAYVGRGISQADLDRRRLIWERWRAALEQTAATPVQAAPVPGPVAPPPAGPALQLALRPMTAADHERLGLALVVLAGLMASLFIVREPEPPR